LTGARARLTSWPPSGPSGAGARFRQRLFDPAASRPTSSRCRRRPNWHDGNFSTKRGRLGYDKNRHDFTKLIWQTASPKWYFDYATFERSEAFNKSDHVAIVIHSYRWRIGLAAGDQRYDNLEAQLSAAPVTTAMPTVRRIRCLRLIETNSPTSTSTG
jgi:hypothetical protein